MRTNKRTSYLSIGLATWDRQYLCTRIQVPPSHVFVPACRQLDPMAAKGQSLRPSGPGQSRVLAQQTAPCLATGEVITMAVKTATI